MSSQKQTYWNNGIFHEFIDGVLRREIPKQNGVARFWHPNGVLAREMTLVNGVADGIVREWHENGKLACEKTYKNGEVDGTVRHWNSEGTLLGEYEIKMGWGTERKWNEDGSPKSELEKVAEGAYRGRIWDDRGKPHDTFLWNGKPVSKNKFLDKLGRIKSAV